MTLSEFKAWFEGFTEDMEGPPNEKQWKRICERLATVTAPTAFPPTILRDPVPDDPFRPYRYAVGQNMTAADA